MEKKEKVEKKSYYAQVAWHLKLAEEVEGATAAAAAAETGACSLLMLPSDSNPIIGLTSPPPSQLLPLNWQPH